MPLVDGRKAVFEGVRFERDVYFFFFFFFGKACGVFRTSERVVADDEN